MTEVYEPDRQNHIKRKFLYIPKTTQPRIFVGRGGGGGVGGGDGGLGRGPCSFIGLRDIQSCIA